MNAWEKTCDTWRLLAAEIDGSFTEGNVAFTSTHLATLDKQYKNWKISFHTTGHTVSGTVTYVPNSTFNMHVKRKRFDWTDSLQSMVPPFFMMGTQLTSTGYDEMEYLYSITTDNEKHAHSIIQHTKLRELLMSCDGMQNFLIMSMKFAGIETGSILLFDLGKTFTRSEMRLRYDVMKETLSELHRLGLASDEAPQAANHKATEDLFEKFNPFKKQ